VITIDYLNQQIDIAQQIIERERREPGQPITDAHRTASYTVEGARAAIRWLSEGGLTAAEQVGPFGSKNVKRGDKIVIRKGTVIHTTHPRWNRQNPKIAGRDYTVEVHDVYEGHIQSNWHSHKRDQAVRNQQVVWAGTGGYWCWVESKDAELVD